MTLAVREPQPLGSCQICQSIPFGSVLFFQHQPYEMSRLARPHLAALDVEG